MKTSSLIPDTSSSFHSLSPPSMAKATITPVHQPTKKPATGACPCANVSTWSIMGQPQPGARPRTFCMSFFAVSKRFYAGIIPLAAVRSQLAAETFLRREPGPGGGSCTNPSPLWMLDEGRVPGRRPSAQKPLAVFLQNLQLNLIPASCLTLFLPKIWWGPSAYLVLPASLFLCSNVHRGQALARDFSFGP